MPRRYPAVGIAALVRESRIERCLEAAGITRFQIDLMHQIVDCRQHDFRRERERRHHRPWRDGAVVRPVRYAAPEVIEELALDAVYLDGVGAGSIARGDAPAVL